LRQDVSVAALANMIDAGQVGYTIAGYFGGHADQDDWARLSATFAPSLMPDGHSASAGMVKAADRGDVTGLVYRSVSGFVPIGTRDIGMLLDFLRACQTCDDYNHGYADTLSVVLQVRDNTPPVITPVESIRTQPTGNVALDFYATDVEDGGASVEVHSSNQAVIQDAWIVLSGDDGDPTHRVYSIVPGRTGATRMGTGRTVMAITAYDSAGLRTDQYVVVDILEDVYLPAIMK
jgi:hypothetical protein